MPTFCRHNRFIERCPICSKTLPGAQAGASSSSRGGPSAKRRALGSGAGPASRRRGHAERLRVRHEGRAADDGYRSDLVPGLRASSDAERLARDVAQSVARLVGLAGDPPGLYGQALASARTGDLERASWICFMTAFLGPPAGEREEGRLAAAVEALELVPSLPGAGETVADLAEALGAEGGGIARSAEGVEGAESAEGAEGHAGSAEGVESAEGAEGHAGSAEGADGGAGARASATLIAYAEWVRRNAAVAGEGAAGPQAVALTGDPGWTAERRFERLYERLSLPGLSRAAKFDFLVTLGALGLYELRADALHLGDGRGAAAEDPATVAAKRVFGIGDPLLLERRADALAVAGGVPLEALDEALARWGGEGPQDGAAAAHEADEATLERLRDALSL